MNKLIEPVVESFLKGISMLPKKNAIIVGEHIAKYLTRMLEFHKSTILHSNYINSLIITFADILINGSDPTTAKVILLLFEYVLNIEDADCKERIDSWVSIIMIAVIQVIAGVINLFTEISMVMSSVYKRNKEVAKEALCSGLMQPCFNCVPENIKSLFVKYIECFHKSFAKFKPIVTQLNKLLNGQSTTDDFIGYELQLVQANKDNI